MKHWVVKKKSTIMILFWKIKMSFQKIKNHFQSQITSPTMMEMITAMTMLFIKCFITL